MLPATPPSVHLCKRKGAVQIYRLSVTEPVKFDGLSITPPIRVVLLNTEVIKEIMLLAACHLQNVNGKGSSKLASSQKPEPLRMCHNTLTPARTPRFCSNVIRCCIVKWGLSSAMISSLRNSIHPPEVEINPPLVTRPGLTEKAHGIF